jgi:hypothetical protein
VAKAHLPLREAVSAVSGTVFDERRHFSQLADAVAAFQKSSENLSNVHALSVKRKFVLDFQKT